MSNSSLVVVSFFGVDKNMIKRIVALLSLAVLLQAEVIVIDGVAAHVNGHIITIGDVTGLMTQGLRIPPGVSKEEELRLIMEAYDAAADELISRRLIIDQFNGDKLVIPPNVIDQRVEVIIDEKFGGDRSALLNALKKDDRTFDDWRETIREQIIVSSMRYSNVEEQISISPEHVRRYYDEHLENFSASPGVKVSLIVLKNSNDEAARIEVSNHAASLLKKLEAGEDFATLARQHSEGTAADQGGDRGWIVPEDELRRELVDALSALKVGEVSPVITTPEELYIVKKEEIRSESVRPYKEVQHEVESLLRRKESDILFKEWVQRLKADSYIRIFDRFKEQQEKNAEVIRDDEPHQP